MSDKVKCIERETTCKCIIEERPIGNAPEPRKLRDDCLPQQESYEMNHRATDCSGLYEELGARIKQCLMQKRSGNLRNSENQC